MPLSILIFAAIFSFCLAEEAQNIDFNKRVREADEKFVKWAMTEVVHFTIPLQILGIDKDLLEDWVEDAKDKHMEMYIDELASIVYDAIGAVESLIPFKPVLDEYIKTAKLIGPPEVRNLRYVGEEKDFEANRRQFGKMFRAHIETLLMPKVKTGSHDGVMESHVPDVVKIRHFVDKHWTRHGRKNTTVETPDAEKTKWTTVRAGSGSEL
ncbi:hypothetical protein DdX_18549 [Ditylenchus destructor]|uniref:Uncharacterized protein n=1 Tax=Ditylenchus destructor TaxID=166010 RepID=A0AAD4QY64_9BILA|nr:hypothetical protein DdX_18549 [Ditylenchus destructor]